MSFVLPKLHHQILVLRYLKIQEKSDLEKLQKTEWLHQVYLTSHMPAYYNHKNCWIIPKRNSQNCVTFWNLMK